MLFRVEPDFYEFVEAVESTFLNLREAGGYTVHGFLRASEAVDF